MAGRRVQKVLPVSASASSRRVEISQTNSIFSDPDGRWVAKRQEAINEAFENRLRSASHRGCGSQTSSDDTPQDETPEMAGQKLSGESDRIGRNAWNETTPFGGRIGFF